MLKIVFVSLSFLLPLVSATVAAKTVIESLTIKKSAKGVISFCPNDKGVIQIDIQKKVVVLETGRVCRPEEKPVATFDMAQDRISVIENNGVLIIHQDIY
jgi:hypothetical protein